MGDYWEKMAKSKDEPIFKTVVIFEKDIDWTLQAMLKIIERKVKHNG